jgi:hypothetical protein
VIKLAEASVSVPVEGANQAGMPKSSCARPKRAIVECSLEPATDVESTAEIFTEDIQ